MRKILAVLIACLTLVGAAGCRRQEAAPEPTDGPLSPTAAEATLPPPAKTLPQDTVRVAMRTEVNANPLFPKHYSTEALYRLVYEPLFDSGVDGRLEGVLAESLQWSADGLKATVILKEGRLFHDGNPVGAEDAVASLTRYLALRRPVSRELEEADPEEGEETAEGEEEPETYDLASLFQAADFSLTEAGQLASLANITAVEAAGSRRLVISLQDPDPALAGLLTFPVIPAGRVDDRSWTAPPGSGPWSLLSADRGGLTLQAVADRASGIRRIEARSFPSIAGALAAFEAGEIDLLLMDSSETALFADRSRMRKQRFDEGGFISLFFGGPWEKALTRRDALLYILSSDPAYERIAAPWDQAAYPVLAGDYRLAGTRIPSLLPEGLPEAYLTAAADPDEDPAGRPGDTDRQPFRLLVPEGYLPERLIDNIGTAVLAMDRRLTVSRVGAEGWQSALRSGQYEAALLVDRTDRFPDPVDYLEGLAAAGLFNWEEAVDPGDRALLLEARHFMMAGGEGPAATAYTGAVARVFEKLPVLGLAASASMVWYGDQVEGIMTGTWRSPYEGVEELLIWRR